MNPDEVFDAFSAQFSKRLLRLEIHAAGRINARARVLFSPDGFTALVCLERPGVRMQWTGADRVACGPGYSGRMLGEIVARKLLHGAEQWIDAHPFPFMPEP